MDTAEITDAEVSSNANFSLHKGKSTTHVIVWNPDSISYYSYHGFVVDKKKLISKWDFAPGNIVDIPQLPTAVNMNLWLRNGMAPKNNKGVDVVIKSFSYTPKE